MKNPVKTAKPSEPVIKSVLPFWKDAFAYEMASMAHYERCENARTRPARGCE